MVLTQYTQYDYSSNKVYIAKFQINYEMISKIQILPKVAGESALPPITTNRDKNRCHDYNNLSSGYVSV